jgi:NADPH:quinone reductase-like Zn-dependent oxidoreductase
LIEREVNLPELPDDEVRIQVLYSGISKNEILYLDGFLKNDYFGVEVIGKIVALGKNAAGRKVNEIVGIAFDNVNHGSFSSGFSTYIQTSIKNVVFIPNTIQL